MTEDYLHYTWQYRLFNKPDLHTTGGERIVIIQPGIYNRHAGPDFLNAKVKIGEQIWSGHIEIHIRASDWKRHGHTHDGHYKNVVLHVVYVADVEIFLNNPGDLPVLDISNYMIGNQWDKYQIWLKNKSWIACQSSIDEVDSLTWTGWKDSLLVERLERKSGEFIQQLKNTQGDWSEVFYRKLAKGFGFKVNSDAMERLAESLPLRLPGRHRSDPFQVEALYFGQAGFLGEIFTDEYPTELQKEYLFLSKKYDLKPMDVSSWNFGRLRPSNFPTIRIAQLAALTCSSEHLFTRLLAIRDVYEIAAFFDIEIHDYWNNHFRFDALSRTRSTPLSKRMGSDSQMSLLINTVAPGLFAYGKYTGDELQVDKAIKLLEICRAEDNRILKNWSSIGVTCHHASDSQALIELYNSYCSSKQCLKCRIGLKLLKG